MAGRSLLRFALLALLCTCWCTAQQITGALTGTVTDPSGSSIPGAQISLTNAGTGVVQTTTSNEHGDYQFLLLPAGSYTLHVASPGFKSAQRTGIVVEVNKSLGASISLQLGDVDQVVDVSGGTPLLEPNSAALGSVIDEKKVSDLPLNGRNPMGLVNLIPTVRGIGYFGGQTLSSWRMAAVSIGGGAPLTNGFLVDGIANDKMVDSGPLSFLTVDSTQEVTILTNGIPAEFGRTGGGVINMISKAGTNQFHGNVFEYLKNDAMNANSYFGKRAGSPRTPDKVNQFGASIGGPILKDKLFFFLNYEGYRERSASTETITSPTALERTGDFSDLKTSTGQQIVIYDPASTVSNPASPGTYVRTAFPGNKIPASRLNAVGRNVLSYYPMPNLPGTSSNLFLTGATPINKDTGTIRVDYNATPTRRFSGRYTADDLDWQIANYFGNVADVDGRDVIIPRKSAFISYTEAITPSLLLDIRTGLNHQVETYQSPGAGFDITKLGMPASLLAEGQANPGSAAGMFPRFTVSDLSTFGGINYGVNHDTAASVTPTITWTHGPHTFRTGYEFRLYQRNEFNSNYSYGSFTFDRGFTQGPDPDTASTASGYGTASLLLGTPSGGTAGIAASTAITLKYNALFVQDDWKMTHRLTLNLGLRWEKEGSPTDRQNVFSNFDPNIASPLNVAGLNLTGGIYYPGVNGAPRGFFTSSNKNFQPRIGVAYQATEKTVIRSAFGISYVPTTQGTYSSAQTGFGSTTTMVASNDGGRTSANTISDPFPSGLIAPTNSSLGASTGIGTSIYAQLPNIGRGYSQQWNLNIQHQPFNNWLVEAGYVGNRGVHLFMYNQNLNALPEADLALGSSLGDSVANPFYGSITSGALSSATVPREQLLLPHPQFTALSTSLQGGVTSPFSYLGSSTYHALTFKVEKAMSHGYSLLFAYTLSKTLDRGSNLAQVRTGAATGTLVQDWNNLGAEKARSLEDIPQRFVATALWSIPFGKNGNVFYRSIVGGWQANSIITLQSGSPISLAATVKGGGNRPNVVPGTDAKLANPTLDKWFNTSAFSQPAAYTYGNASRTIPNVSSGRVFDMDYSMFKDVYHHDRYSLQFRVEAFNLTNTPSFAAPGTTYGSATFGKVTSTAFYPSPRVLQLALQLKY